MAGAATRRPPAHRGTAIDTSENSGAFLALNNVRKVFGTFAAVDGLTLGIHKGEVFSLLGPSGCGKSTTLRQIAGLDQPTEGTIRLADRVLVSVADNVFVAPQSRNMGMVFQSYAIWPHLSVFETIAYPLRVRRVREAEIENMVRAIIAQVGLAGMEDRSSQTLSGGQQQRVALARALVYKPDVLLLDEPFSNLDVKLREQMRVELKLLQREVGVTVILVTHDQSEALSLSDRIAIMDAGRVEQVGSPIELYERPATRFVRDFVGQITHFRARITAVAGDGTVAVTVGEGGGRLVAGAERLTAPAPGDEVLACVRPELMVVHRADGGVDRPNWLTARLKAHLFLGEKFECFLDLEGQEIMANASRNAGISEGDRVWIEIPDEALTLWPM